jgi:hypothetical protein
MKRRDFVATVSLGLAAGLPAFTKNPSAGAVGGDWPADATASVQGVSPAMRLEFASALGAAEAIRKKQISSVELTRQTFARIDRYNPQLNAFAYQTRDEAMVRAKQADEAQAHGKSLGVLHGVPIHVKESYAVAGHPCTWGIPALKDSKAPENSEAVNRLLGAGAVLLGGTNVPINLGDWQSYNEIYGNTNNPWDVKRTPGGSSGGTAAALAAGLGYLGIGSDIGGSIRVPAHFCGRAAREPRIFDAAGCGRTVGTQRGRFAGSDAHLGRTRGLLGESLEVGDARGAARELARVSRGLRARRYVLPGDGRDQGGARKSDSDGGKNRRKDEAGLASGIQD